MTVTPTWKHPLNILLVGQMFDTSRTVQRVRALEALGCAVKCIPTTPHGHNYETPPSLMTRLRHRMRLPADPAQANTAIIAAVEHTTDVLWLDAADVIRAETLVKAKRASPGLSVLWYSEDDMMNRRLRTRWLEDAIPHIDLWVTTKSFNIDQAEVPSLGVRRTLFVNNSCDPSIHRPVTLSDSDARQYGAPISFIGTFEEPRAKSILQLAQAGYEVRVWGNGWGHMKNVHEQLRIEDRPAYNDEFAKVIAASQINLCFLRHANRDLQTCRSVEISGCAGFMAHERNPEIEGLFRDEKEAVYFSNDEELVVICDRWLGDEASRRTIGDAAHARVEALQLDHKSNVTRMLNELSAIQTDTMP